MSSRNFYEEDRLQCQAKTDRGTRCTLIATHGNGKSVLCERHHRQMLVKKANDAPIVRKAK